MLEAGLEVKDIESANVTKTYSESVSYKDINDRAQDQLILSASESKAEEDFDP